MSDIKHPTVPIEYAGKWIAWDHAMSRIVASADSLVEVLEAAKKVGENDPVLDKVPPANVRLIGARLR
ncbi:MAG: DUF5678 domain-containing protein [Pirellulales bacterium]